MGRQGHRVGGWLCVGARALFEAPATAATNLPVQAWAWPCGRVPYAVCSPEHSSSGMSVSWSECSCGQKPSALRLPNPAVVAFVELSG